MQASADVHETLWRTVLVAPAGVGGRWIDEIAARARPATGKLTASAINDSAAAVVILCRLRFTL